MADSLPERSVRATSAVPVQCSCLSDAISTMTGPHSEETDAKHRELAPASRVAVACRSVRDAERRSLSGTRWCLTVAFLSLFGCQTIQRPAPIALPARRTLESEHLLVRSDMKLPKNHKLLRELDSLRDEISETLQLPVQKQPVTVYLFSDEVRYAQYLHVRYPKLPPRRAYFVGTAKELAVYTFWGEKIQEDLRHEYTHGVLHASLQDVPHDQEVCFEHRYGRALLICPRRPRLMKAHRVAAV